MLASFHFLQPYWLLLIPVVFVVAYFSVKQRVNRTHWQTVCDPELLPFLEHKGQGLSSWLSISLLVAAFMLIVAAAQPVWKKQPQPVFKQGDALVIALDLSASMNAVDLKPSRLQRAHFKIEDLLAHMPDANVALLVYAAEAFSVTPLTDDSDTIFAQLPAMVPEIMPAQGSRADKALALADQLLAQAGVARGNILLISDEVMPVQIASIATRLKSQGRQISILGVGTEQGAPINTDQGLLKDRNGQVIVAKVQASLMQESAGLGGGQAKMITADDSDVNYLIAQFQRGDQQPAESKEKIDRWVAEGPWFILFALPFVLMVFRRGIVTLLMPLLLPIVLFGIGHSSPAQAEPVKASDDKGIDIMASGRQVWTDLWQTKDKQGLTLYRSGDKASAAEVFEDPQWKQLSYYESGQYDKAVTAIAAPQTPTEWYNLGNVLTRKGELAPALNAYDQALEAQPDFEDARYNRNLVAELLKQQQSEQQQKNTASDEQKEGESKEDHAEGSESQGANAQNSEGSVANDTNTEGLGPQEGSSQNANAEGSGFDNQSKASKQHAKNSMSGDQASSDGNDESSKQEKQAVSDQLQKALKDKIDQQLKDESGQAAMSDTEDDGSGDQKERPQGAMAVQGVEQTREPLDEAAQARQQLLNRIEDDPAGLWRRKFIYQYHQQPNGQALEEKQW